MLEANLTGANLKGADLRMANLEEANLSGADLSGTDLSGTDLGGAIQMSETMYDKATTWPANFDPLKAGAIFQNWQMFERMHHEKRISKPINTGYARRV